MMPCYKALLQLAILLPKPCHGPISANTGLLVLKVNFWYTITWLCFGSMLETGLITQECFLYFGALFTHNQGLFCFLLYQWVGSGVHKALGGIAVNSAPREQRDIQYHMPPCSAYKAEWRRWKGECSGWWHLLSQITVTHDRVLLSWRFCWWEVVKELLCLSCVPSFCCNFSIAFNATCEFPHLHSSDSLPHLTSVWE